MMTRASKQLPEGNAETITQTGMSPAQDNNSDDSATEEARPTHTAEIGTLKKLSAPGGTAWLGSSSGVYFVNTVRRAFSAAFSNTNNTLPASEDILTGEDAEGRSYNGPVHEATSTTDQDFQKLLVSALGSPPADRGLAMDLVTSYFQSWHPLFPFLHGPRFLKDMDQIYASMDQQRHTKGRTTDLASHSTRQVNSGTAQSQNQFSAFNNSPPIDGRKVIAFQLIINIASLDRNDIQLPESSRIKSVIDVARVAGLLALNHDIQTIQALIAAELYLVATIALRQASTVAGIILKLLFHAGLHRCPLRYAQLSHEDCEIRKRIFWSAYALDRHLSLALGDPNTVQDSDIDVCLSGRELHRAVARDLIPPSQANEEIKMHRPRPFPPPQPQRPRPTTSSTQTGLNEPTNASLPNTKTTYDTTTQTPEAQRKQLLEAALTAYVHYGKLTGRIIEIFHKSINHRFPKQEAILYLNSDIETWWNDLPSSLTDTNSTETDADEATRAITTRHRAWIPFFTILYQQLLLLLNRPRLSLDQSTAEFQHGLQVCIKASRNSLAALRRHRDKRMSMLLPGLLSATWMAGLIIAFACQLGKYPKSRAVVDITACLNMLEAMNPRWYTVKNCHKVLSLLLANIKSRKAGAGGFLSTLPAQSNAPPAASAVQTRSRKRPLNATTPGDESGEPAPKRDGRSESSPTDSADIHMPFDPSLQKSFDDQFSTSFQMPDSLDADALDMSNLQNPTISNTGNYSFDPSDAVFNSVGDALYANPQDLASAQSSHDVPLPNLPGSNFDMEDTMFWANLGDHTTDIFSAASWESLTGPTGPMFSMNGWDMNFGSNTDGTSNNM